jgi:hypothetical protein
MENSVTVNDQKHDTVLIIPEHNEEKEGKHRVPPKNEATLEAKCPVAANETFIIFVARDVIERDHNSSRVELPKHEHGCKGGQKENAYEN